MSEVDALLPVLVAELEDDARSLVTEMAQARRTVLVPLVDAPVDASLHVLEVTTPGTSEPLLLLAEPCGPPTERGFPLRLHPYDSPPAPSSAGAGANDAELPSFRATRTRPTTLTKHHTRDLLGENAPPPSQAASRDPRALVGREIAGKLIIEDLVGIGGMGAVYRARHKQLDTRVAVKVLHEHFRSDLAFCARFHAEALVISQLDHINVVRISDFGQEPDGLLYFAMDYLEGVELCDVLVREGTLPLPRIVDLAMQVSAGLGHAHTRGIFHRDVKPSNIIIVETENDEGHRVQVPKVCDFGIAARSGARDLVGTPAYMSPEQCEAKEVDGRSDIYALGVIMYELATGQLPFSADDPMRVVQMQIEKPPAAPSLVRAVDERLEALIMRMLEKAPAARPQTMKEVRGELRALSRPPSLQLHDVGASRAIRGATVELRGQIDTPKEHGTDEAPVAAAPGGAPAPPPLLLSVTQMDAVVIPPNVPAIAARLSKEPVSTLREKLETPERFLREAQGLAAAMRLLLDQKEHGALAQVIGIFEKVATDPTRDGASAELAARIIRTLQDPAILAPVAEHVLASHDETAQGLLGHLGLAAAHALYSARMRMSPTPLVRGRFVSAMRAVGQPAWGLVATALSRTAPEDGAKQDQRLAEDLLRAMPLRADDALGGLVAKYLRWGDEALRRAAIPPLVALWTDRAKPLLVGVLTKDPDEGARVAALKGLRDLKAIDEHVVRRAEEILTKAEGAALAVVAAEALGEPLPEAREVAIAALRRLLSPKGGLLARLRAKAPLGSARTGATLPPLALLAVARAFVTLGADDARKVIEDLAKQSEEPLRTQLLGVRG